MALVIRQVGSIKAEIRLQQAVQSFEADLSEDQRKTFKGNAKTPHPNDVMQLTAEIDKVASLNGVRRPFGPRLKSFLEGVQLFAALGDILVGGSQNLIACGVWSLVRLSLMLMVNFSSHLEKLSTVFMTIGKSAPRYQAMALVYPHSKDLQDCLSEYFIIVVELCHSLLRFTKKSALGHLKAALHPSEIRDYEISFEKWAKAISEQMTVLMAKRLEDEARENSKLRALARTFSETYSQEKRLRAKIKILDSCSTYDYEAAWKQLRKIGNSTLFHHSPEYEAWKNQSESSTIIFSAKLGSGKSVLLANILDDLHLHCYAQKYLVAYFFCKHDTTQSLDAKVIYGSLARQLLSNHDGFEVDTKTSTHRTFFELENITSLLTSHLKPDKIIYIVLDDLYACSSEDQKRVLDELQALQRQFKVHICLSIRLDPESPLKLNSNQFVNMQVVPFPEQNPDITDFIDAELSRCLEANDLLIGDPELILEIREAIVDGHEGMFLWAALQIKSLCYQRTDENIRKVLKRLPRDLPSTFERILHNSKELENSRGLETSYQLPILMLLVAAKRPLTTDELREALSVVPGVSTWNPARLVNDIYSTLVCCGSLVVVDEETLTVQFVHESVKAFLLAGLDGSPEHHTPSIAEFDPSSRSTASKSSGSKVNPALSLKKAEESMADIVITYLSYSSFETRLTAVSPQSTLIKSTPQKILNSIKDPSSRSQSLALKLLRAKKEPGFDVKRILAEAQKIRDSRTQLHGFFLSYAKSYCWRHLAHFSCRSSKDRALFVSLLAKIPNPDKTDYRGALLPVAVLKRDVGLVRALLESSTGFSRSEIQIALRVLLEEYVSLNQVFTSGFRYQKVLQFLPDGDAKNIAKALMSGARSSEHLAIRIRAQRASSSFRSHTGLLRIALACHDNYYPLVESIHSCYKTKKDSMLAFLLITTRIGLEELNRHLENNYEPPQIRPEDIDQFRKAWAILDPQQTGYIPPIPEALGKLLSMLRGVFDMRIYPVEYSVRKLINRSSELTASHATARGLSQVVRPSNTPPPSLDGELLLRKEISNLNHLLQNLPVLDIRRRRKRLDIFYEHVMADQQERGLGVAHVLLALGHYAFLDKDDSIGPPEWLLCKDLWDFTRDYKIEYKRHLLRMAFHAAQRKKFHRHVTSSKGFPSDYASNAVEISEFVEP